MTMSIIEGQLGSDIADDGTFTVNYPSGKDEGAFALGVGHKISVHGHDTFEHPVGVFLTFGASNITVKNKSGATWKSGASYRLQLEELGDRQYRAGSTAFDRNKSAQDPVKAPSLVPGAYLAKVTMVSLGAPDTADVDGIAESQTPAAGGVQELTLDGAAVSGGEADLDVPRNVTITSAGDETGRTFTVTGKDVYGNDMVEEITGANAGTAAGKKAFDVVTKVEVDADTAGAVEAGFGDVLGLPSFLPSTGLVLAELEDGSAASAGTAVAGVQTEGGSTATTGDVRGTYDPNSAADGDKYFHLVVALPDPDYLGMGQYTP